MLADIRYALRTFAKRPSFAVAAIATLALGIAVNTIAFSLLNSLALRPMPVRDAGRVVRLHPIDASGRRQNSSRIPTTWTTAPPRRSSIPWPLHARGPDGGPLEPR
jgi:hypothetical protein